MENEIKLFGEDSTRLNSPVVYRHLLWAPMNLNHHPTDKNRRHTTSTRIQHATTLLHSSTISFEQ